MARDIGDAFEDLTRNAPGGRRSGGDPASTPRKPAAAPAPARPKGGLRDRLRDILKRTPAPGRPGPTPPASGGETRTTRPKADLPPEGVVTVEYAPRIDGDPDPGEVIWAFVPFEEDPTQGKDRPIVVIGRRGSKLVGVPLTSKQHDNEAQVAVGTGDWDPKGRPSFARIWRMLDVDVNDMRREGAILDRERFDLVVAAVDTYYDVKIAKPGGKDEAPDF